MSDLDLKRAKFVPPKGRGVLVCIEGQMSDDMTRIVVQFRESNPRENVFFLDRDVPGDLPVDGGKVSYPFHFPKYLRRFFRRLRVQIVLVDRGVQPPGRFIRSAATYNVSVGFLDGTLDLPRKLSAIAKKTQSRSRATVYFSLYEAGTRSAVDCVIREVVREPEEYTNFKKRLRLFVWEHFLSRIHSSSFREQRSVEQIRATLNDPESVLCLGNGPSSEDEELKRGTYDSVFRVNHRWLERECFTEPDAVFTGALDSVQKVGKDLLYVFITGERSSRIVMKASKKMPKLSYANAEDLGFPLDFFEPYQPTNGVIMLYFAVMLQPARLIVAGIDLYRDSRGCYAGESDMPNGYTSAHSEQRELEMILDLLHLYQGDLTIIGESLQTEYEQSGYESKQEIS